MSSWSPHRLRRCVQDHDVQSRNVYGAHIAHIVTCNVVRSLTLHIGVTRSRMRRGTRGHEIHSFIRQLNR